MLRRLVFGEVASLTVAPESCLLRGFDVTVFDRGTGRLLLVGDIDDAVAVVVVVTGRGRPRSGIGGVDDALLEFTN